MGSQSANGAAWVGRHVQPERTGRIVRSVTIQPDGSLAVEYITPMRDLKSNGVELNHVV